MDFVTQAPATVYLGTSPQAGVVYVWRSTLAGSTSEQYILPTGEHLKNGKPVVRLIDTADRGQSRRYKVKNVGMDAHWFARFARAEQIPTRVYEALVNNVGVK